MNILDLILKKMFWEDNSEDNYEITKRDFEIAKKHKLQTYLHKYLNEKENRISEIVYKDVLRINNKFNSQLAFAKQISMELEHPLIVFKGFTNYFLNENRMMKRESGDLDFLYKDPEFLRQLILTKEFSEFKYDSHHEYSCLENLEIGITIDIHKYIPILAYPIDIQNVKKSKDCTLHSTLHSDELNYNNMMKYCSKFSENIYFPNVSLCLLILCTSVFRDYIARTDHLPHFKLVDLLEISNILEEETFNKEDFESLVNEYNAYDSVNFVGKIFQDLVGEDPFNDLPNKRQNYPQVQIWNFNSWFIPPSLIESIFHKEYKSLFKQLDANVFNIMENEVSTYNASDQKIKLKYLVKSTNNSNLNVSLNVLLKKDLELTVTIYNVNSISEKDIINFNFGNLVKTYFGSLSMGKFYGVDVKEPEILSYSNDSKSILLKVLVSKEELDQILEDNEVPLHLYIEKYDGNVEYNFSCPLVLKIK